MPDIKEDIIKSLSGTDEVLLYEPLGFTAESEALYSDSYIKKDLERPEYLTLSRLFICNTDSTDITVTLYLKDSSDVITHLLHSTLIPVKCTLDFNNGIPVEFYRDMKLCIKLGGAGFTADVNGMITGTMNYNN
tara:strand:+ start:2022 stop:2423 length:402 start_codon:yes stop_codon:yes gene_type:complete